MGASATRHLPGCRVSLINDAVQNEFADNTTGNNMKLFIGNATSQNFNFHYRLPERTSVTQQFIAMGEQVQIIGDLSQMDIDAIIKQGNTYGMLSVEEIDRNSTKYHGLCYSIGKEISSSKIEKLFVANTGVLVEMGRELRKNAAIVENSRLLRNNQEMGLPNIRGTEMSIQQEQKDSDTGQQLSEGFRAQFDTPTRPARQRRAR